MEDKYKENPKKDAIYQGEDSLSPIPLSISSPPIKPEDKRLIKANAYESMKQQANQQIDMLKKQAELIMKQVKEIEERVEFSKLIYQSDLNFEPVIGNIYHLYQHREKITLTMIAPYEWGNKCPFEKFLYSASLLADRTWKILN